jgi:outer membrane murein-binding lipoprotein Lpp
MEKGRFARQLWISFGIIIASIAIAGGALAFLSGQISAQADTIASDRAAVQEKTDAVANLATLKAAVPQAAQYQSAIDQLLPSQYGLVTFTQWLAQLGAKYNVTTDAAFQGSVVPSAAGTAGTAQFFFSAEGSPDNLTAFLDGMNAQSSGFLVSITAFDVTNNEANDRMTGQGILFFQ